MGRQLRTVLLIGLLLFSTYGCSKTPGGDLIPAAPPATNATTVQPTDLPKPDAASTGQAERLANLLESKRKLFGPIDDPQLPATDWVGLDESNRLVVSGINPGDTPRWMKDPDVTRLIIRWPDRVRPGVQQYEYAVLTRERYSRWPAKAGDGLPFPTSEWPKNVDLYGAADARPEDAGWAVQGPAVRDWMTKRLGNRLVDLKISTENDARVTAVVKAEGLSEQKRVQEAASLLAGLHVLTSAKSLQVEYQGVTGARVIEGWAGHLTEWAKHGADLKVLSNCFDIDGVEGQNCPGGRTRNPRADLIQLFAKRDQMKALLPGGSRLTIANAGFLRIAVDGDIPAGQSWEQAWATYTPVVDKLFTQAPEAFEIQLTLRRGSEVEFLLFDYNQWSLRHFLTQAGITLEPATLTSTANFYRRYKVTSP
jgi:hypothetical protein